MIDMVVRIDKAGRIVLPKKVREELAINPGGLLNVSMHDGQVTLRPNRATAGFLRRGRVLVFSTGAAELLHSEAVEAVRQQSYSNSFGPAAVAPANRPKVKRHAT
jgi:AbrB family looped-hinge helix DNA binding protein